MTRHFKDLGSAFDRLRSKGGEGGGGKKEKKEGGRKKGEGIGERGKGTPAMVTPLCSPLRALASANSYCFNQTTSLFSKPNWRFQLASVLLSNIFRTITSPLGFKINAGALSRMHGFPVISFILQ